MDNPIPISALQHYAFCPRQCAYIHIEQLWQDNYLTAKGNQLHERVHSNEAEQRALTVDTIHATRKLLEDGAIPPAVYSPSCRACSFFGETCHPRKTDRSKRYVTNIFEDEEITQ